MFERTLGCGTGWCSILNIEQHCFNIPAGQSSLVWRHAAKFVGHCPPILVVFIFRFFKLAYFLIYLCSRFSISACNI